MRTIDCTRSADDLITVLWMAGTASHDPAAPAGWRRVVDRSIASAWTAARKSTKQHGEDGYRLLQLLTHLRGDRPTFVEQ
jgi:hypothetical protein